MRGKGLKAMPRLIFGSSPGAQAARCEIQSPSPLEGWSVSTPLGPQRPHKHKDPNMVYSKKKLQ